MHNEKKSIRKTYRLAREQMSEETCRTLSLAICKRMIKEPIYLNAKHVAFYKGIRHEVCLDFLLEHAIKHHKNCYYPVVEPNKTLTFVPITKKTVLQKNTLGLLEPICQTPSLLQLNQIELFLVPLVAFDLQGIRLGMGGGYYDKTLSQVPHIPRIGVAYECQQHPHLPYDTWDLRLDGVITEKRSLFWAIH